MKENNISPRKRIYEITEIIRRHDAITNFVKQTNPAEFRCALEELGPTFIKIGQLLSTRPDLVSPAYMAELAKLQDNVRIDDFATVSQTFFTQTGHTIEESFLSFEEKPFASASIGQTHRATLHDGTQVVVKVQHPNIPEIITTDLELLQKAVKLAQLTANLTNMVVDPKATFTEIKTALNTEIDTQIEITNGIEFYELNNNQDIIRVPQVFPELSTNKILVNSYMPGESIKKLCHEPLSENPDVAKKQQAQRTYIANVLVQNFIKQVFTDRYFHADPHPGNILFQQLTPLEQAQPTMTETNIFEKTTDHTNIKITSQKELPPFRIIYLDFGMMGRLSKEITTKISNVILALYEQDLAQIGQAVLSLCNQTGPVNRSQFFAELDEFLQPYLNTGISEIDFAQLLFEIVHLCQRNNLQVKPEVTLLIKAFGSIENTVAALDPNLSLMDVVRPFAQKYLIDKFDLQADLEDQALATYRALKATPKLPGKINQFLDNLSQGKTQMKLTFPQQPATLQYLERIINRLITAIVLAAIIVGSSLLVQGSVNHPTIYKIGVAGYLIAVIIIVILLLNELHYRLKKRSKK
ncbi:ABC1 kinase family protein [Ligilactobacillus ceti]|uniref:Ubiquinone biosynthesis protein UbiB n=1 Tax=Ligilactobacillus ceti DSM 22408 TaxID=1122146 RepID=A0A0R2KPM1_9LACO|nr:AarF/UbiB family protein [Ligilactobacillus ceti]KRN89654.1 ubiquinone biosynthesis protein UbiB [Ligilactobacillus ceti DSM 22408]